MRYLSIDDFPIDFPPHINIREVVLEDCFVELLLLDDRIVSQVDFHELHITIGFPSCEEQNLNVSSLPLGNDVNIIFVSPKVESSIK
mmetsp:Transcript_37938/g.43334  ORF Transcript_37938/g.43334 Transcript_37938/m.43334 type:complete len:87 (-) Transcript_37938:633-893(-)